MVFLVLSFSVHSVFSVVTEFLAFPLRSLLLGVFASKGF
jgi:hypothetical protein